MTFKPDDDKFKELVLYVAMKCQDFERFGATKLNKILFFSDFLAFARTGKPITGQEYMKLPEGPAPRRLKPLQEQLLLQGDAAVQRRQVIDFDEKRLVALRPANLEAFNGAEIAVVDEVIDKYRHRNAKEISGISHQFIGWKAAAERETIPYATVFVKRRQLTQDERAYARTLIPSLPKRTSA